MADILTADERAAIAAYPEAQVQRIARGVTGESTYMYDPLASGQLRPSIPCGWREQIRAESLAAKRGRYHAKLRATRAKRRRAVDELARQGRSPEQIAVEIGSPVSTVKADLLALRRAAE